MRRLALALAAAIAVSNMGVPSALGQNWPSYSYFGGIQPSVVAFDPGQSMAAVAGTDGVFLIDFSDPEAPVMMYPGMNEGLPPPSNIHCNFRPKVALESPWLLMSYSSNGLWSSAVLYDVSDPAREWPRTVLPEPYGEPHAVNIVDGIATVVFKKPDGSGGVLALFQLGGDDHLLELGSVEVAGFSAIVRFGSIAAVGGTGIDLVDLSDPAMPVILDHIDEGAVDLTVTGNVLAALQYLPGGQYRLVTVDISDPTDIAILGATPTMAGARSVCAAGDHVYIGRSFNSMGVGETTVVSIADPATPTVVGTLDTGAVAGVGVVGDLILTAAGSRGARLGRLADATTLAGPMSRFSGRVYGAGTVEGGRLFLSATEDGVWIVEPAAYGRIIELGSWAKEGHEGWSPIAVDGNLMWTASGGSVFAVDISDIGNPATIGELATPVAGVSVIAASGGVAAVRPTNTSVILLIDARDLESIVWAGQLDIGGGIDVMEMSGSTLVWLGGGLVHIVDVSDPWAPVETASFEPGDLDSSVDDYAIYDLTVEGGQAWVNLGIWSGYWGDRRGIFLDIADPWAVEPSGFYPSIGESIDVTGLVYASVDYPYLSPYLSVVLADLRRPGESISFDGGGYRDHFQNGALTDGQRAFGVNGGLEVIDFSESPLFELFVGGFEWGDLRGWSEVHEPGFERDPPTS